MRKLLTVSVPQAGQAMGGCGKAASYEAARKGEISTIQIGRRKRVPVRWIEEKLKLEPGTLTEEDFARAAR